MAQQYINRDSLTTNLKDRYDTSTRLGGDIGTAKLVGTTGAATDFINGTSWRVAGRDVHSVGFNLYGRTPGFTIPPNGTGPAAQYSSQILGLDSRVYYRGLR